MDTRMKELSEYLIDHMILDFGPDVDIHAINDMLVRDGSPLAHTLRARILADGEADSFLLVLADCLKEHLRSGIRSETIVEQIKLYTDA